MSKKLRIVFSCVLTVLAFAAGLFAYAQSYGNKTGKAIADEPAKNYFVDKDGKIEAPPGENTLEDRMNRGTEDNPFLILEIVPYDGMAKVGYLISGQEPIDVDAAARDGVSIPGETNFYNTASKTFMYWKSEMPVTFPDSGEKMKQFGTMTYVADGSGQYSRSNVVKNAEGYITSATYTPTEGGNYSWAPLTPEECEPMNWNIPPEYSAPYQDNETDGYSFKMYFNDVQFSRHTGKVLTHKNDFLLKSVGLAYETDENGKRDYVRDAEGNVDWTEINRRVSEYEVRVFTVTPEDLNMNPELVDRADMITISCQAEMIPSAGSFKGMYVDAPAPEEMYDGSGKVKSQYQFVPYIRKDKIGYEDSAIYGRVRNVPGADFSTNPLSWEVVLKIYERYTDPEWRCPIIADYKFYDTLKNDNAQSVVMTQISSEGTLRDMEAKNGTQNNLPKLFLMVYQMTNPVFEAFYGEVTSADHAMFSSVPMVDSTGTVMLMKDGTTPITTGVFNYDLNWTDGKEATDDNSRIYWNANTLLPWHIVPYEDLDDLNKYSSIMATYEVMVDSGYYNMTLNNNTVRNGFLAFDGDNKMGQTFATQFCGIPDGPYGYELYDYFDSIRKTTTPKSTPDNTEITMADCINYLLNGVNQNPVPTINNKQYKILELQPSSSYEDVNGFWKPLIAVHTNSIKEPLVTQMTTSEFIGSQVECISDFDLVYIGMNKLATDPTMKFTSGTNFVYAHTGPQVDMGHDYRALYGWLRTYNGNREKHFAYSGNDLTTLALNRLKEYENEGFPIMFGNGFFSDVDSNVVVGTIDRNSNIYALGSDAYRYGTTEHNSVYWAAVTAHKTSEVTKLKNLLTLNSPKVDMIFESTSDYPVIYNSAAEVADRYINGYSTDRTLKFKFKVQAPAGTEYDVRLFVDSNTDGIFSVANESLDLTLRRVKSNGGTELVSNGKVKAGQTYTVERAVHDRIGSVCWKLTLEKDSKTYAAFSGVSAIKASASETEDIVVLQIVPVNNDGTTDGKCSLYLPTQEEIDNDTFKSDASRKFNEKIQGLNGMNIKFVRNTEDEIIHIMNNENPEYFDTFDMLVLGFGDTYNGVSDTNVLSKITEFIDDGKAVLYTHDTSSGIGNEGGDKLPVWGKTVTEYYREMFGMDRYGALAYLNGTSRDGKDYAYKPVGSSDDVHQEYENGFGDPLVQGVTNGMLYRGNYTELGGSDDANINAGRVSRVNRGAITEYPYTLPDQIPVASTHPQYYQLDMENKNIVVWYCLEGGDGVWANEKQYEKDYFGASRRDVRNNYYIYNINNVTYSGMGHMRWDETHAVLPDEEIELFVNTFVAAYRASVKGVKIEVLNSDVTSDVVTGEQFTYVKVDSSEADTLMGADIMDNYRLEAQDPENPGTIIAGTPLEKKSKRIYFRLRDNNSYGDATYDVDIVLNGGTELDGVKVDGVNQKFAVFERDTGKLVGADGVIYQKQTVYYVDVPIHIATNAQHRRYAAKTELDITVTMEYGEERNTKEETTKVNIYPDGLFDLD